MTMFVRRMKVSVLAAVLGNASIFGAVAQQSPVATPIPSPVQLPQSINPALSAGQPTPDNPSPPMAEVKPVTDAVVIAALRYIEDQKLQGSLVREGDLAVALAAIYSDRNRPFWTSPSGFLVNAQLVIDEMRRADDWGLNSKAFEVPALAPAESNLDAIAAAEVALSFAVLKYSWHARGGRIEPTALSLWLDSRARPLDVGEVLTRISASSDAAEALRKQHPQHAPFEQLRQAYLKARGGSAGRTVAPPAMPVETMSPGPLLTPGMRHPDIAVVRRRLDVPATGTDPNLYDTDLANAVRAFLRQAGLNGSPLIGAKARAAFNEAANQANPARPAKANSNEIVARRLLANMERWRWLPEDLGRIHIWNNLPEFETRVFKDGQVVHQERIIIGKSETQTPVFSDAMRVVVFQPDWGVPNSIKIKDLLPGLKDGDDDVLSDKGMRISMNGKTVDPGKFDWDKVDIRTIPIVQDPGPSNPLGQIKFLFPNKHDVYMHDTPTKHLFNQGVRTFSHGCIRVRNPRRLAEVIFAEDQNWAASEVQSRLEAKAPANTRVPLSRRIPVHNAYFTVIPGENGTLKTINDIYGHDQRITAALDGVPASQIAQSDPARKLARELQEITGESSDGAAPPKASSLKQKSMATASLARTPGLTVRSAPSPARSALGGPVRIVPASTAVRSVQYSVVPVSQRGGASSRQRWPAYQNRALEGQ